ncbi:MAG TPA: YcaO-like family protein [Polyangiaceae bacterium]
MISWPSCRTDSPGATLAQLMAELPLSARWRVPEMFCDASSVSGLRIHLVGLCCESREGECATGSAASVAGPDVVRAYFELVERAAVLDATSRQGRHDVCGRDGAWRARVAAAELFPESPEPERWRYARSNGVALGRDASDACARAEWELVERDRVLRSWQGESTPLASGVTPDALSASLFDVYEFQSHLFPPAHAEVGSPHVVVAGVFGFPKQASAPLIFGFAGRATAADALDAASRECVQRLGFLWGETIPVTDPPFAPTAEFHQEYFLWPRQHDKLRSWLAHGRPRQAARPFEVAQRACGERCFADLTPALLRGKLAVMKALPLGELPLVFGESERATSGVPRSDFHPIP